MVVKRPQREGWELTAVVGPACPMRTFTGKFWPSSGSAVRQQLTGISAPSARRLQERLGQSTDPPDQAQILCGTGCQQTQAVCGRCHHGIEMYDKHHCIGNS